MDRAGTTASAVQAAIADAGDFLTLLERERAAVHTGNAEALSQVCHLKKQALVRLGAMLSLLRQPEGIDPEQRLTLRNLILRCGQESQVNEAWLRARAARTRRQLQALQGSPTNYDGRGLSRYGIGGLVRGAA